MKETVKIQKGGVTAPAGFRAAGVEAGIKYANRKDVALIVSDVPCTAAAMFTTNKVAAAPVVYDRVVAKTGKAQAVIANSGCANACTGAQGAADAAATAIGAGTALGIDPNLVFVASTGVIGAKMPMDRLSKGIAKAAANAGSQPAKALDAARAIMTTDTKPKYCSASVLIGGAKVTIGAMCKGSGMIEPNMATMLGFITTDASISAPMLRKALRQAVEASFNHVVVDGDESTNDSVFILANGMAGNAKIAAPGEDFDIFKEALQAVAVDLARKMAKDGEGATKFVTVTVKGAKDASDAAKAARAIAKSPLVKTSWFGGDPNWGRVLAATGYSGAKADERKIEIFYDNIWAYRKGTVADQAQLKKLAKVLRKKEFSVTVDMNDGSFEDTVYTCDLSTEYIHINADYTT